MTTSHNLSPALISQATTSGASPGSAARTLDRRDIFLWFPAFNSNGTIGSFVRGSEREVVQLTMLMFKNSASAIATVQ